MHYHYPDAPKGSHLHRIQAELARVEAGDIRPLVVRGLDDFDALCIEAHGLLKGVHETDTLRLAEGLGFVGRRYDVLVEAVMAQILRVHGYVCLVPEEKTCTFDGEPILAWSYVGGMPC
jgi:hypothetical protein